MAKRGRPRLLDVEHNLHVRLDSTSQRQLNALAKDWGCSLGEVVRSLVLWEAKHRHISSTKSLVRPAVTLTYGKTLVGVDFAKSLGSRARKSAQRRAKLYSRIGYAAIYLMRQSNVKFGPGTSEGALDVLTGKTLLVQTENGFFIGILQYVDSEYQLYDPLTFSLTPILGWYRILGNGIRL